MFYKIVKNIAGIVLKPFYKMEIYGSENIPVDGNLILCSNHASNLDPILISIALQRQVNWMGKEELFQNNILSFLLRKLGVFPINRTGTDIKAIKNSLQVLKEKKVLGIFPEGTRVKEFDPKNVKHGAVLLSVRSKSPILPVYIESNYKIFNKIKIYIGEPIKYYEDFGKKTSSKQFNLISQDLLRVIYNLK